MKKLIKHIGMAVIGLMVFAVTASAQFDDVYFDPSKDLYNVSSASYANSNSQRGTAPRASRDDSYNYAQSDQYAYDDDEYDYYNDDLYYGDNYYFDDYAYARRINRFHRNRFFYDPFLYDDMYMMGMMSGMMYGSLYNPYRYAGMYNPFYRPGFHLSLGFGMPYYGFNSFYGFGYPSFYNRFYSPYSMFYDPIMAYNYGYGVYGNPYVYMNNVNHGEMPQYYRGARTSGAAGVVPVARDGRAVQTRSSGVSQGSGEYTAPTTRSSPRAEDRSNRAGSVRSSGENQNLSPRSSGETPTRATPRSNTYTPSSEARTDRVYRSPGTVERVGSGERSTYTPRSQSTRSTARPSATSPRSTYTPNRGTSSRVTTPSSRNTRSATPARRPSTNVNRSAPTRSSVAPSPRSSSSSSSRSSGASSGRSSPR